MNYTLWYTYVLEVNIFLRCPRSGIEAAFCSQENIKNGFLSYQHDIINHGEKLRDTPKTMIKHLMVRECL